MLLTTCVGVNTAQAFEATDATIAIEVMIRMFGK